VPSKIELPLHQRVNRSFLDYASYVIRDRAIPHLADGLKPVQRRILWALHEKDDGRFIKVANVAGNAMQYHPHGDASIGAPAPSRPAVLSVMRQSFNVRQSFVPAMKYTPPPVVAAAL
jgi:DNA gyrase/topoisomerase IV subunit A